MVETQPGPWTMADEGDVLDATGCLVRVAGFALAFRRESSFEEARANTLLAAAAPDLLAALRSAELVLGRIRWDYPNTYDQVLDEVRAAIVKATVN